MAWPAEVLISIAMFCAPNSGLTATKGFSVDKSWDIKRVCQKRILVCLEAGKQSLTTCALEEMKREEK